MEVMGERGMMGSMIPIPSPDGGVMARRALLQSSALMLPSTSALPASSAGRVGRGLAHESHSSHATRRTRTSHAMNGRDGNYRWWLGNHGRNHFFGGWFRWARRALNMRSRRPP
jgi:hypothetical protein